MIRPSAFSRIVNALEKGFGFGVVAHPIVKLRQAVEAKCGIGMIRTKRFFVNRQRAPVEGFGFGVVAHHPVKRRQVVEPECGIGMLRAERFFVNRQELPSDGDSLLVFARMVKVNNLPIEGISLGDVLQPWRPSRVSPTTRNAESARLPVRSEHTETRNTNPCSMLGINTPGTHRAVKIQRC